MRPQSRRICGSSGRLFLLGPSELDLFGLERRKLGGAMGGGLFLLLLLLVLLVLGGQGGVADRTNSPPKGSAATMLHCFIASGAPTAPFGTRRGSDLLRL